MASNGRSVREMPRVQFQMHTSSGPPQFPIYDGVHFAHLKKSSLETTTAWPKCLYSNFDLTSMTLRYRCCESGLVGQRFKSDTGSSTSKKSRGKEQPKAQRMSIVCCQATCTEKISQFLKISVARNSYDEATFREEW